MVVVPPDLPHAVDAPGPMVGMLYDPESLRHVDATRAAHLAGFADLAHFSRTCRRMLGHSPTTMRSALLAT